MEGPTDPPKPAIDAAAPQAGQNPVSPPTVPGSPPLSTAPPVLKIGYLSDKLDDAELLLSYASEVGITVKDEVRNAVLKARIASDTGGFSEEIAANLLLSLTTLAGDVRPVTVESLKTCANKRVIEGQMRAFRRSSISVACVILIISFCTFVSSRVAEKITTDITTANGLAAKLSAELGPPPTTNLPAIDRKTGDHATSLATTNVPPRERRWGPDGAPRGLAEKDVITDLQQFAATMREIDGYALQLRPFVVYLAPDLDADLRSSGQFQLTPGLGNLFSQEFADKIQVYQSVRDFGTTITEKITVYYGAIALCLLPVLYALLGAEAFLLRTYEDQIKNRTFVTGGRHPARYLIAGIGGMVVGLFNVSQGVSISPFAVAFLVGYAADAFFAFLDGSLQMFKHGPTNALPQPGNSPKT